MIYCPLANMVTRSQYFDIATISRKKKFFFGDVHDICPYYRVYVSLQ